LDVFGLNYYPLPGGPATYRFTDTYQNKFAGPHIFSTTATAWTFTSSRPAKGNVAAPYACFDTLESGDTHPCAWQPLIFLNYHLGLGLDDTAPAGRAYHFTVTAQDGEPTGAARLAGLRLWISPDGGTHWSQAEVERADGNAFRVVVRNPERSGTTAGFVSIKTEAWDGNGDTVQQTVYNAYAVK
jgi:hypothetical protein